MRKWLHPPEASVWGRLQESRKPLTLRLQAAPKGLNLFWILPQHNSTILLTEGLLTEVKKIYNNNKWNYAYPIENLKGNQFLVWENNWIKATLGRLLKTSYKQHWIFTHSGAWKKALSRHAFLPALFKTRIRKTMSLQLQAAARGPAALPELTYPHHFVASKHCNAAASTLRSAKCLLVSRCLCQWICAGSFNKANSAVDCRADWRTAPVALRCAKALCLPSSMQPISLIDESCDQHQVVKIQFISSRCLLPACCGKTAGAAHDDHMLNVFTGVQNSLSPLCQSRPLKWY